MPKWSDMKSGTASTRSSSAGAGPYGSGSAGGNTKGKNKGKGKGKGNGSDSKGDGKGKGKRVYYPNGKPDENTSKGKGSGGAGKGKGKGDSAVRTLTGQLSGEASFVVHGSKKGTACYLEAMKAGNMSEAKQTILDASLNEIQEKVPVTEGILGALKILLDPDSIIGIFMDRGETEGAAKEHEEKKEVARSMTVRGKKGAFGPTNAAFVVKLLAPLWAASPESPVLTPTRQSPPATTETSMTVEEISALVAMVARFAGGGVSMKEAEAWVKFRQRGTGGDSKASKDAAGNLDTSNEQKNEEKDD
jgi:hypothetical protein